MIPDGVELPSAAEPAVVAVLPTGLVVARTPDFGAAVDVLINGRRVWSAPVPAGAEPVTLAWPPALLPFLDGTADVRLQDPATGVVVATGSARLGTSSEPITVADERGRRLAINKWGNLGIALEGADTGLAERMLTRAQDLVALLAADGWTPFVVGGTLLGAARAGALLPNDDDIDLAVLMPDGSHPADLVLESFRLQRLVESQGLLVVRHSASHLQVTWLFEDGSADHYVDIFLAFYRDGWFYEPLAMQVPAEAVAIEPLSSITIEGHELPAPADIEGWLAACYGPGWRVPDPTFRFDVPLRTRRRFWNWFGNYDLHRIFWSGPGRLRDELPEDPEALLSLFPQDSVVVDVGSGRAAMSRRLAEAGHPTIAVDFALPAVQAAAGVRGVRARRANLNDTSDVLDLAADLLRDGRSASYYCGHTYEGLSGDGKANLLLLLQHTLTAGAVAVLDFYTAITGDFVFEDPTTWHVEPEDLERDARARGLAVERLSSGTRETPHGSRPWVRCRITKAVTGTETA
ncbi:LicD family protein [Naasia sp. SYSU D00057]|uniref:LicD family protein n=1 Tax=Naasia sp. SYSU D00057 TaxID=2817380 RepID=UPI001B30E70D|nr:LicD family protein [Naasia sp. SYSU D00057]